MVLPVRRRIHWGIGRFCFWALANFCFVRKDLWDYSGVLGSAFVEIGDERELTGIVFVRNVDDGGCGCSRVDDDWCSVGHVISACLASSSQTLSFRFHEDSYDQGPIDLNWLLKVTLNVLL